MNSSGDSTAGASKGALYHPRWDPDRRAQGEVVGYLDSTEKKAVQQWFWPKTSVAMQGQVVGEQGAPTTRGSR